MPPGLKWIADIMMFSQDYTNDVVYSNLSGIRVENPFESEETLRLIT